MASLPSAVEDPSESNGPGRPPKKKTVTVQSPADAKAAPSPPSPASSKPATPAGRPARVGAMGNMSRSSAGAKGRMKARNAHQGNNKEKEEKPDTKASSVVPVEGDTFTPVTPIAPKEVADEDEDKKPSPDNETALQAFDEATPTSPGGTEKTPEPADETVVVEEKKAGCCKPVSDLRKRMAPSARKIAKTKTFQTVMFLALLAALFLPDIWLLADRPDNTDLDIILTVVFFCFITELVVQAIGLFRTYFGSFFFWMDLLGAGSLLLDLSYLGLSDMISGGSSSAEGGDDAVSDNAVIMRMARIAKLGARAGRFSRLVKLLKFLPGMGDQAADAGTAKVISGRLIHALSTRVSCLIIVMVIIMPLFTMFTYPEMDWSMKSWLTHLEATALNHPHRLASQLKLFEDFYKENGSGGSGGYYPYKVRPKTKNSLPATTLAMLPWESTRGAPIRTDNAKYDFTANLVCEFDFTSPNQVDSLCNILLLFVIMLLMVGFSMVLSNSVSSIVLRPLERLLLQVRQMAATIFQSVADMAQTLNEDEDDEGLEEDAPITDHANAFSGETELLEKVVQKLAVLSEITMQKNSNDNDGLEGLAESDRAVINGFQGTGGPGRDDWDDETQDANYDMMDAQKAMVENAGLSLEMLNSWNLNPLELDKARNHAAAMYFLGPHNHGIAVDTVVMAHFIETAEAGYIKFCPYHNWFHAIDVTHCVYRMLIICSCDAFLSAAERFSLLVSALCHDVGHIGLNNTFLIETSHELALRYNDKSPLENMHCAKLFEYVAMPKCNIFASFSKSQFQEVRKKCIEAILHTDNAMHFGMIKEVQMLYEMNSEILECARDVFAEEPEEFPPREAIDCFRSPETRRLLGNLILHTADISNSLKPFRICRLWAMQVVEEFFVQGDTEKKRGMPVQALNDREKVNKSMSQIGFNEFLVAPLMFSLMKVLPPTEPLAEQMVSNVKSWHQLWQTETKPVPPEQEKKAVHDRIIKLEQKFHECHS